MSEALSPTSPLTIDDLLNLNQLTDAQLHPDGSRIAYTVSANVSGIGQKYMPSRIWLAPVSGDSPRAVTAETMRTTHPRWSPHGCMLAYLGAPETSNDPAQIYVLDQQWSEGRQVTHCTGGIATYAWASDGKSLLFIAPDAVAEGDAAGKEAGKDWTVYEAKPRYSRAWRISLADGQAHCLTPEKTQVWEFSEAPGGQVAVAIVSDLPHNWSWYANRLVTIDLQGASPQMTTVFDPGHQLTGPVWSPDGSNIAVIASTWSDQGMTGGDVMVVSADGKSVANITDGHLRSYLSVDWTLDPQRLLCSALENGESTVGWLALDGTFTPLWRDRVGLVQWGGSILSGKLCHEGLRLATVMSSPTKPAEVFTTLVTDDAIEWQRLTDANPTIRARRLAQPDPVTWRAQDGLRIQGLLVRPLGNKHSKPYPAIVLIHGGPTSLWGYGFNGARSMGWVQLLVEQGFAVFLPNPRGSVGFGREFAEANLGDMGGADYEDIIAGVDYLVDARMIDPARLGVGGWSYGGYLTAWAVTQTDRFKAAVAGASITNWISFHGTSTINAFDRAFYCADPFSWDGCYGQFSPMAHIRNAHTPTLFLHGELDPICPVGQAHEMWRALGELDVETELVVYPREGHGPREREHLRDVLERGVAWFTERILGAEFSDPGA